MLRTEYVPIDDVRLDDENPKDHRLDLIARSYEQFGYVEPVIMDERTGTLLAGHGRIHQLRAWRDEGLEPPEHIEVVDGVWTVPVSRGARSKDDDNRRGMLIALNRISEAGGWVDLDLHSVLTKLPTMMLETVGYSLPELEDLTARLFPPSLEELAARYPAPDPEALWPVISVNVPPDLFARWRKVVDEHDGDPVATIRHFVDG